MRGITVPQDPLVNNRAPQEVTARIRVWKHRLCVLQADTEIPLILHHPNVLVHVKVDIIVPRVQYLPSSRSARAVFIAQLEGTL